jgi:hypothetical protein
LSKYFVSRDEFDKFAIGASGTLQVYRKYYDNSGSIDRYEAHGITKIDTATFETGGRKFKLHYKEVQVQKVDYRKPHPVVKNNWDDRVKRIKESIHAQESTLDRYVNEDLKGIRSNLFVRPEYANVVETKLNELRKNLASMNLETDKLKDYYEKVGNDSSKT